MLVLVLGIAQSAGAVERLASRAPGDLSLLASATQLFVPLVSRAQSVAGPCARHVPRPGVIKGAFVAYSA